MKNFWNNYIAGFFTKYVDIDGLGKWMLSMLPKLVGGLLILVIGWWLAGAIAHLVVRGMERAKVDQGVREFLYSCVKIIVKILVVITALSTMGMNVTTLIAALGTAGVAIGLALKDSLSNFASGVLILFNHIFKVGDFIEIDGQKGTVRRIELMFTTLATADNKRLEYTSNYALQAWTFVMKAAHKGLPSKRFNLSKNVVSRSYCTVTGGFASGNCGSTATGYYSRNSAMPICPIHGGGSMTKAFTALMADSSSFYRTTTQATTANNTTAENKTTGKTTEATQAAVG